MAADSDDRHFRNVEEFLGAEWLEDGCVALDERIVKMREAGFLDNSVEAGTHALHKLWYTQVLGKNLPSDLIISGDYRIKHKLTQAHRLLTVEQLLAKLRPTWDSGTAENVRSKLRNPSEFESTLYELQVTLNFRDAGHDVNLRTPSGGRSADIGGMILGLESRIECKRVTFRAATHLTRLAELEALASNVLELIVKWGRSSVVSIELPEGAGSLEMDAVLHAVGAIQTPPDELHRVAFPGPSSIWITTAQSGTLSISGDLERYDVLKTSGEISVPATASEKLSAVGIIDNTPADWSANVRSSLNNARTQLKRGLCNIICLQLADAAYFDQSIEMERVFEATERFLDNDTRRVSGVIITSIGVIPDGSSSTVEEGQVGFRTASQSWLIAHLRPEVNLPEGFKSPGFDSPVVRVKATSSAAC
ncbi:MAG: hypothetical protein IH862_01340 [Chloroflexi bacterium]|nr:hypothetical protein [Chloroflexota bacterium]